MITVLAWIVLIKGILGLSISLVETVTDDTSIKRGINLIVGIPIAAIEMFVSYYVLFII